MTMYWIAFRGPEPISPTPEMLNPDAERPAPRIVWLFEGPIRVLSNAQGRLAGYAAGTEARVVTEAERAALAAGADSPGEPDEANVLLAAEAEMQAAAPPADGKPDKGRRGRK